eukprot:9749-Eustigmatos_ZCMA.PRE.1
MEAMAKLHHWSYVRLDGSTAGVARQGIIDEFQTNESIFIFFISTKVKDSFVLCVVQLQAVAAA